MIAWKKLKTGQIRIFSNLMTTRQNLLKLKREGRMLTDNLTVFDKEFACDFSVKSLGVLIDNKMTMEDQIAKVCNKGISTIGQLWRLSSKLSNIVLKTQKRMIQVTKSNEEHFLKKSFNSS